MTGPSGRLLAVSTAQLQRAIGHDVPGGVAEEINDVVWAAQICTHLELAHFVGQCAYECAYFHRYDETTVPGQYEFRLDLGNTDPGDGFKFHGRGAIQLTGRRNYTRFCEWLMSQSTDALGFHPVDVVAHPEVLVQPPYRWLAAAWFWRTHPNLRRLSDEDDVTGVTRVITGAQTPGDKQGLQTRIGLVDRMIEVLG